MAARATSLTCDQSACDPRGHVGDLEERCRPSLYASIPSIVTTRGRNGSMAGHLLNCGQIDPRLEQVACPGPAQVVGSGGLDARLAAALLTDRPDR
jgi:hypothetical protein